MTTRSFTAAALCLAIAGRAHAQELAPVAGTVPVTFQPATGQKPLQIGKYNGSYYTTVGYGYHGPIQVKGYDYSSLCETPCTLNLPPGSFPLSVRGDDSFANYHTTLHVPLAGADVQLRTTSRSARTAGKVLAILAPFMSGFGVVTFGASYAGQGHNDRSSRDARIAGATLMGVGVAVLAIGLPLYLVNTGAGAARVRPHTATSPGAKLTLGPGGLGLSGTF